MDAVTLSLLTLTTYIIDIAALKYVRKLIDIHKHGITGNGTTATPEEKIAFYYSKAQKINADTKTKMVEKLYSINTGSLSDGKLWDLADPYSFSVNVGLLSKNVGCYRMIHTKPHSITLTPHSEKRVFTMAVLREMILKHNNMDTFQSLFTRI